MITTTVNIEENGRLRRQQLDTGTNYTLRLDGMGYGIIVIDDTMRTGIGRAVETYPDGDLIVLVGARFMDIMSKSTKKRINLNALALFLETNDDLSVTVAIK